MNKFKTCDKCHRDKVIWKNVVENGERKRYCKECWSCQTRHSSKPTSKKPLAPRSKKRAKQEKEYSDKRKIFMSTHPMCQANISGLCTQQSTDVHHIISGSNRNTSFLDDNTWLSVCRACHSWIHLHPKTARDLGLLK